jgi:hypothetical protein
MHSPRFDYAPKNLTQWFSRRRAMRGSGVTGIVAAPSPTESATVSPAPRRVTHRLTLGAYVRVGPSANAALYGGPKGYLSGDLEFGIAGDGTLVDAALVLSDGTALPVAGQAIGRALHLRVAFGGSVLVLVGTAAEDLGSRAGEVGGVMTGPRAGDLGDWRATITKIGADDDPSPSIPL